MPKFWLLYCAFVTYYYHLAVFAQVDEPIHKNSREDFSGQLETMKTTIKVLSDQWEKWNTLFITSLEPRITSTASTLSSIDSNIHNLQERAHVWDTFQLHVAAWNDQLTSMDRKIDILNKAIQPLSVIDNKINTMLSEEYKLDKLIKVIDLLLETVLSIENGIKTKQNCKSSKDSLFEEFAARGILSSLKLVERKVDQLLGTRQNDNARTVNDQPAVKCGFSKSLENSINDISSKVDIIFDSVSKTNDYSDEYIDLKDIEGSGNAAPATHFQKWSSKHNIYSTHNNGICKLVNQGMKDVGDKISNLEHNVLGLLQSDVRLFSSENNSNIITKNDLANMLNHFAKNLTVSQTRNMNAILDNYLNQDKTYWSSMINTLNQKCLDAPTYFAPPITTKDIEDSTTPLPIYTTSSYQYETKTEPLFNEHDSSMNPVNKNSCSDLDLDSPSGIYVFDSGDFVNERFFNKQYCEMRDNGLWIVIQRRDNYSIQQDFNVSWHDYKLGFGNLEKDFWIGNNYLARLSNNSNLTLRIELEDFDGNSVWAEYKEFKIAGERQQFQLTVQGYSGNATDAFSSHSGSPFSTYDRKNDYAPECCACSVSFGGGWWFHSCFESNLNGIYYKNPFQNGHFRGIIWEHWLGNYSLRKSLMMVKSTGSTQFYSNSKGTKIEDP